MLHISPETPQSPPPVDGLRVTESEWELDVTRYESFLESATGIDPADELRPRDCYRVGNRLEALVDEHRREGTWTEGVGEEYPDVESREEIVGLARFFRECHECRFRSSGPRTPQ